MNKIQIPLPPGVRAEEFVYRDGSVDTVYFAPTCVEGPTEFTDQRGTRLLAFMYDYFVFLWPANTATLDIRHGRLSAPSSNMMLFRGVTIHGSWHETTLRTFAIDWVSRRRAWASHVTTGLHYEDEDAQDSKR